GDPAYNKKIVQLIRSTHVSGMMGNPTGFAALFDFKKYGYRDPLLVSSTDGVGTKLEIAHLQNKHDTIGIDLVAMCVNDIITSGARPIFFLDYYAAGRFDSRVTHSILRGVVEGCQQAACALVGGETAIMPGFYSAGGPGEAPHYDLAGFSVGIVERKKIIDGRHIREGDLLLGVASSGFHSNGYSLLRKIFSKEELKGKIGRMLLKPTIIYVRPVLRILESLPVQGIVNITGGGLIDNLPRVIPQGLRAIIKDGSWPVAKLFHLVQVSGNIPRFEMMRTYNLGIGLVLILRKQHVPKAQSILKHMNLASWVIGRIARGRFLEVQ
ncbi:MAG: phosphoribosylformylglycinamidine cyclo-ligase, partial [Candidatus Omnitrophica bacterium]|nr:phosphoribosylformylglycinamidine cyclo-ligase [Candidatus Omnitrophota bacterium]